MLIILIILKFDIVLWVVCDDFCEMKVVYDSYN